MNLSRLVLGSIAGLGLGATAAQAQISFKSNCSSWQAPESMEIDTVATLVVKHTLPPSDSVYIRVPTAEGPFEGELQFSEDKNVKVAFFRTYDGRIHIALRRGVSGFVRHESGETSSVGGGQTLNIEFGADEDDGTQCVRLPSDMKKSDRLVTPAEARRRGRDVDAGVITIDGHDPDPDRGPITFPWDAREKEPENGLSNLFDGSEDDASKAASVGGSESGLSDALVMDRKSDDKGDDLGAMFAKDDDKSDAPDDKAEISVETIDDSKDPDKEILEALEEAVEDPVQMCNADTGELLTIPFLDLSPQFFVVGQLSAQSGVSAASLLPFTNDIVDSGVVASISEPAGNAYVRVALPFGSNKMQMPDGAKAQVVRFPDAIDIDLANKGADPADLPSDRMHVLVASDAATLAQSGLAELEKELLAWSNHPLWSVEWVEITATGELLPRRQFESYHALVAAAAENSESEYFASDTEQFRKLTQDLKAELGREGPSVDQFFWLIEGIRLPHTAPSDLERFIQAVDEGGNVTRRDNGRARKWLELVAGEFSTPYAQYYLEGPVKTTGSGYFTVEVRNGKPRDVILQDTKGIVERTKLIVRRTIEDFEPTETTKPKVDLIDLAFARQDAVSSLGIMVRADALPEFASSLALANRLLLEDGEEYAKTSAANVIDLVSLANMRTDEFGAMGLRSLTLQEQNARLKKVAKQPGGTDKLARLKKWTSLTSSLALTALTLPDFKECQYFYFSDEFLN